MPDHPPPSADWWRAAIAAALSDFPEGDSVEFWQDGHGRWCWRADAGNGSFGLQLPERPTEAEIVAEIAYFLQAQVFDQNRQTWGEARPQCPGHAHPPDPRVIEGQAAWVCPDDGRVLAAIGHLA